MAKIIFIIFICFALLPAYGQEQGDIFNHLSEKDGLKNNIVFSFLKDKHDILWVGTQNGLNRFDGAHFYTFKKKKDQNSLPNNTIHCLCEDTNGQIWGGTDNGIFTYSSIKNEFQTYYAPKEAYDNSISNIQCDKNGDIYASTTIGLIKLDRQTNTFELLIKTTQSLDSIDWFSLGKNRMLRDERNDGIWMSTKSGILYYDNQSKKLHGASNHSSTLFSRRNTSSISRSKKGYYWFCDNDAKEVISFDPKSKNILEKISIKKQAPEARASTILEDSHNKLWISSWSYDILTIDLDNQNKIEKISSDVTNKTSIAANFFWAGLEDENGTIWLGTPNGISLCNPSKYVYKACNLPQKIPALLTSSIYLIEEDPTDLSWWILTTRTELFQYFPKTKKVISHSLDNALPDKKGNKLGNITRITFFNGHTILTSSSGTWILNKTNRRFEPWHPLPSKYSDLVIRNYLEVDSLLYFTDGQDLIVMNKKSGNIKWINTQSITGKHDVKMDINYMLWRPGQSFFWTLNNDYIATVTPDYKVDLKHLLQNATSEAGGYIHAADMDKEGNVWINNKGVGLYRYTPKHNKVSYWNELDGLSDNHMHSLKADDLGNIWTLYFNKVSVFNPTQNSFINFTIPYSEHNLNYFNCSIKRKDGVIMGSIGNDMFEFYAENLRHVPKIKAPQLNVLNASGKEYFLTSLSNLSLSPDENSLRFTFGLLVDAATYPHEFEYKLEGSDEKWIPASISNEANYNNLSPGNYTFRLKAKGKNNVWQSEEKVIHITIRSPFYKTTWFFGLLLIALAAMIYFFYHYRMSQKEKLFLLESKSQLLEKEKTIVMYESLKQQLNPHFLFNSLTSLSGLIDTDQELAGSFLEQMSGIYRYILKNGDSETVNLKDEIQFAALYISLQQTRFKHGLQVNININEEFLHYKIAPVTLQNLIENAIKHNIIDIESPLIIDIYIEHDYIVVKNNIQKKNVVETSNKKGLIQFITLYKYLTKKPIKIEETEDNFCLKIPLI
ncbi:MAG TPA: histidine kinase [Saprospiraceae bacterium]|nr:histidine kinase [Saprospiraceae bacterium]